MGRQLSSIKLDLQRFAKMENNITLSVLFVDEHAVDLLFL